MNTAQNPSVAVGWGTIIIIYLLCVTASSCVSQVIPIVGDIARFFHAPRQQVSWVISIPSVLIAAGGIFIGWVTDRVGDKPLVLIGVALLIVGDLGATLTSAFDVLLLMRVLEGTGYGLVAISAVTMIARVTSGKQRTTALTLWSSYIPMSFAIPLALAGMLAGTDRWRWAFSGHAIVMLVLGVAALWLPSRGTGTTVARTAGLGAVLRSPDCYALAAAFATVAFVQTGVISTLPHTLSERFGLSVEMASSVGTLGMFCNILGCLLMGWLLNRGLSRLMLALSCVLLTVLSGSAIYLPGIGVGATVCAALAYFLCSGKLVGLWALLPEVAPRQSSHGAASGLVSQLTIWGVLFGPPAAFAAQAAGGSRPIINIALAFLLCALMLWLVIHRIQARLVSMTQS